MWENIIEDSITNIPSTYGENELAFLAIQGKIELQLRDKIAWYIEKKLKAGQYAGQYYVRREYNVPGNGRNAPGNGREKCDLAILDNNMKPVCLIEFKAHSAATNEKGYIKMCNHDICKMHGIAKSTGTTPEIYYIFFQTEHQGTFPPVNNGLIAYYNIINRALNPQKKLGITDIHNQWDTNYKNGIITKLQIPAGRYYGLRIVIHAMMLKNEIVHSKYSVIGIKDAIDRLKDAIESSESSESSDGNVGNVLQKLDLDTRNFGDSELFREIQWRVLGATDFDDESQLEFEETSPFTHNNIIDRLVSYLKIRLST